MTIDLACGAARRRGRAGAVHLLALVAGALLPTVGAVPSASAAEWRFSVYLDDKPVGYHRITVQQQGAEVRVESDARVNVTLLSVPVFRYVHHASERWSGGCLASLRARTDDNGRLRRVDAALDGDHVSVSSARGEESIAGCVMTYAYWNPQILKASRLLNVQTGEYQSVSITPMAGETLRLGGAQVVAKHYRVDTGRHDIDVWYSADNRWIGLETVVALGKRLRYRLE